jgi:hypothetical protein
MGSIFGVPTVSAMPSIRAAVFVVGGIPNGGWTQDAPLGPALLRAAANLDGPEVFMINMTGDDHFSVEGVHALFNAIPDRRKRLMFWAGKHDDLPAEAIDYSTRFVNSNIG